MAHLLNREVDDEAAGVNAELDQTEVIDVAARQSQRPQAAMPSETELFQGACELMDQGFGDFEVCLTVLTAKHGNMKLAKNALSKVIFSKTKQMSGNAVGNH